MNFALNIFIHLLFRIPPGTSVELADLLNGLLRREPRDRMNFETFFDHAFIKAETQLPPPPPPPPPPSKPIVMPLHATSPTGTEAEVLHTRTVSLIAPTNSLGGTSLPEGASHLAPQKNSAPAAGVSKPIGVVGRTPPIPGILPPSPVRMST
jgi:hypothetical protein